MIGLFRRKRQSFRERLEAIFDRQTFVTILFLGPTGKTIELTLIGDPVMASRFAVLAVTGLLVGVYWHKLADTAGKAAEKAEDMTNA